MIAGEPNALDTGLIRASPEEHPQEQSCKASFLFTTECLWDKRALQNTFD